MCGEMEHLPIVASFVIGFDSPNASVAGNEKMILQEFFFNQKRKDTFSDKSKFCFDQKDASKNCRSRRQNSFRC